MIREVSNKYMEDFIDQWSVSASSVAKDAFYCNEDGVYVALDNNDNCCWVEEFKTESEAIAWLGEEVV